MARRFRPLVVSSSLVAAALLLATPAVAHVGHGDEFQNQGNVRQVKANAATDGLLGVTTEQPQQGPAGLTVPAAAVVDADGQSLVFVKSGTTYDPVVVTLGDSSGDRVTVTSGVSADEAVVVQGALTLYAESKKTQQVPAASPVATAPRAGLNPVAIGAAAVALLALAGVAVTTLNRWSR